MGLGSSICLGLASLASATPSSLVTASTSNHKRTHLELDCLAFNLINKNTISDVGGLGPEALREPASKAEEVQKRMEEVLQRESDVYPEKLVISLEHKYKQESLCFAGLKGGGLHRHRSFSKLQRQ